MQVGRDEVPQATVRGETERWAGLYSGPGAASALIHRRRPHPQRDDGCTKPAGKPTVAAADRWIPHRLLLGMPLRKKLKSFSFSPQETCCWKRPPTDRRWIPPMPFVGQLPNAPEHELQPFFTRNCGGCSAKFAAPDYTRP